METPNPKKSTDREYIMLGLAIIGDFGATIAIPVVAFVLIGQWLEGKYGHEPWFTISGFVLAALISGRMIYTKAKEYNAKYQAIEKSKTENK
ncbi:MAG TPA: AtpZ/AtpI family protein [Candidatus Magasanikbacteria bacterium]|nr:AtpZ/AtpI family protein [Candidatus Magasanikbacteria bacterium]